MSELAEGLRATLERLDGGRRWCKGVFWSGDRWCLLGALTPPRMEAWQAIVGVACEQFPERFLGVSITRFNDHPDTTWADVELVLEKAIAVAEEELA